MRAFLYFCFVFFAASFAFAQGGGIEDMIKEEKEKKLVVEYSLPGGFYEETVSVELFCPGAKIYYTLDGSLPDKRSIPYSGPIDIDQTTVLLSVALQPGRESKITSNTYFIEEPATTFPVFSLAVTPSVLFDPETGLYVQGPNAIDSLWRKDGANFWSRREILMHTELYEVDRKKEYSSLTGFRLFGGMSRLFPQKSITLVSRDRYGKKSFKHRIFGKEGMKKYKYLVLRNSGSDFGKSHFRDAFMTGLVKDWDLEIQSARPSHVYLNGKYWGIYNIREKVNRTFVADRFDLDKDSIDLIEHRSTLKRGNRRHYLRMLRYFKKHSMSNDAHYAYIQSQMEVDNFMNYQIAQIYFDNQDAGGNIKFWRPQTPTGRWRWILYDTDWGFGLHSSRAYKNNSLEFHTEPDGPSWPNPPWSTFILRQLLENTTFEKQFINRFADHLNTSFAPAHVDAQIEKHRRHLMPEISRHLDRWNLSKSNWERHIKIMKKFGARRPSYVRQHLMQKFDTGKPAELIASSTTGGHLLLNNNIKISGEEFRGKYFEKIPIHLKAVPNYGYRFSHWEGIEADENTYDLSLYLDPSQATQLHAVFEPYVHPLAGKIIFNEVSPNNKESGDWVEIYNNSEELVDLSGWVFTDLKHEFVLPSVTIPAEGYLILCEDSVAFKKEYPQTEGVIGSFNFGLSKRKEHLALYTNDGASIDSVGYRVEPMDTTFTLALLLPSLDNQDFENWELIEGVGTPKNPNPYYLESRIRAEQGLWIRIGIGLGLLLCGMLVLQMRRNYHQRQKLAMQNIQTPSVVAVTPPSLPRDRSNLPESMKPWQDLASDEFSSEEDADDDPSIDPELPLI